MNYFKHCLLLLFLKKNSSSLNATNENPSVESTSIDEENKNLADKTIVDEDKLKEENYDLQQLTGNLKITEGTQGAGGSQGTEVTKETERNECRSKKLKKMKGTKPDPNASVDERTPDEILENISRLIDDMVDLNEEGGGYDYIFS